MGHLIFCMESASVAKLHYMISMKSTLWCQLKDMFQLIVTHQAIEKVKIQLKDTPTKVYAIGAMLFLLKVPLEVLQNLNKKSNKRSVPINRTLSSNWHQRVNVKC